MRTTCPVFLSVVTVVLAGCSSATTADGDADSDADSDVDVGADGDNEDDHCAAMDAREGPDTCDGGGWGYKWNGEECVYQGDLCNCLGADCGRLFETVEECQEAFAQCIPVDCDAIAAAFVEAFEAAVLCDPAISSPQCDGVEMIRNQCGCPWAANTRNPDLAQAARDAWELYEAGGCIPDTCAPCSETVPTFGCVLLPIGTEGTCEVVR